MMHPQNTLAVRQMGRRHIGPLGTIARLGLGGYFVGSVIYGEATHGSFLHPIYLMRWALGLIALPLVVLIWHWLRARRNPGHFKNVGPLGITFNFGLFWVLYFIPATSDMALIFYGTSMVVAGLRGYSGCEILAISNLLLGRDDQIGCAVFTPIDLLERKVAGKGKRCALVPGLRGRGWG